MAKIDIKGKPYEKVKYDASSQQPFRDCLTDSHVNGITVSVSVAKKCKRAKKAVNWSAGGSSVLSALFSSASFGSALSDVGLPAAIPLGGLGRGFALVSSGLIIASKKLDSKIKKHQEIAALAIAKRDTVDRLLAKALADNQISDCDFQLIIDEFLQYNVLKETVWAKLIWQWPDDEKMRRPEKKNKARQRQIFETNNLTHRRFELTFEKINSGFHFSVTTVTRDVA